MFRICIFLRISHFPSSDVLSVEMRSLPSDDLLWSRTHCVRFSRRASPHQRGREAHLHYGEGAAAVLVGLQQQWYLLVRD